MNHVKDILAIAITLGWPVILFLLVCAWFAYQEESSE